MVKINSRVKLDTDLVNAYRDIEPATLGHLIMEGFVDPSIKPLSQDIRIVGPAFTVRIPGMDIGALQQAYDLAEPGDVIVVDRCGDTKYACIGDTKALKAKLLGIEAVIVDGAITDCVDIVKLGFPVFARCASALVGRSLGDHGEIGGAVNCGGVVVRPGDLIVADDNGVVVLAPENAAILIDKAVAQQKRSRKIKEQILKDAGLTTG